MYLLGTPGWSELLLIAFIVLLLFGKNRLPDLAKSMGTGIREFKKGLSGHFDEEEEVETAPVPKEKAKSVRAASAKSIESKKLKSKSK